MTVSLAELIILALDCQATGANPPKGHLLELGWMSACASHIKKSQAPGVQAYLSRLPMDEKIPRAVSRLTGISDNSLRAAKTSRIIWQHLMEAVKEVISKNQMAVCPTVIHFARFEEPFLKDLHHKNDPESPFPFQIICTHQIAIRLLPDLPRRGLRAIAGYFNRSMPEFKRSAAHVVATVFIWQQMIEILNAKLGIYTLDQLCDWLASTETAGRSQRTYPMAPEKRLRLPDEPGDGRVWTPEAVAKSLDHLVMHSAHLIRRARWFCLLSESSLAWEEAGRPGHLKNLIVLEGGSVIQRDTIENAQEVPVPARYDRSFHRRQKHLSLITYDRLRILTTELRRLISENRHIELRLGPTVTLGNDELKKALRWV